MEQRWRHGVVAVSAGSGGPNSAVHLPGNDPFAITAGAVDARGTRSPDAVAAVSWSSFGTTQDGFPKPDVTAPGAHIVSTMH